MCGICGEYRFDHQQPSLSRIERMLEKLRRRGPDNSGSYVDGKLAFGHRRLAIIDLSERANQPMVDQELNLVLVFNGTIYNYPELRRELSGRGYHFFSEGDSEVILKAYAEWGESCVEHLHGMFAFAIWDKARQQLFLARDRIGIKPLYFSLDNKRLRFASSTQALLAAGDVDTTLDEVALQMLFTLHAVVPAPHTILNGIRKLEPASTMTVDARGSVRQRVYWKLDATRPARSINEWEWIEAVHECLKRAVERRKTIADVPVGVLLSGGIDSSLLVGLLAEAGQEDLHTFSVGFEDSQEERGNEFEFSDQVARRFETRHEKILVPNEEVLQRLPEAVDNMAEPMFGQDAVAFYLLAEQVSRYVKVVQSGQGADEVFAGYFWYPRMHEAEGDVVDRFRQHYFDRDHEEYLQMVSPSHAGKDHTASWAREQLTRPGADTYLDQVLRLDVTTLIVDDPVKRVDNMTMAWGLEARVPFLDQELVELVARMPPEIKLKNRGKHPLKAIARGLLPDAVIDRPKAYFPVPALKYVSGEFLDFMRDILNSEACLRRGLYQRDYVEHLLDEPEQHFTRIQGSKLWHLALLEFWLQRNVDAAAVPGNA